MTDKTMEIIQVRAMKEGEWLIVPCDIWVEIFLFIDNLKQLFRSRRVCKIFEKIIYQKNFFLKWNIKYMNGEEIPPFKTLSELFDRTDYKMNLFQGGSFKKKLLVEWKPDNDEKEKYSFDTKYLRSIHSWQPFYTINKGWYVSGTHTLFKKESCQRKIRFEDCGSLIVSDISNYLCFLSKIKGKNRCRITAIPIKENLPTLYYTIFDCKKEISVKCKNGLFSILLCPSLKIVISQSVICEFYQFSFKDFCPQGKTRKFQPKKKILNTQSYYETSEKSIFYQKDLYHVSYFSFDQNFTMNKSENENENENEKILEAGKFPMLVYNDDEEFLFDTDFIIRCKTNEIKKLSSTLPPLGFGGAKRKHEQIAFLNESENIVILYRKNAVCIDTSKWDHPDNHSVIQIAWKFDFVDMYIVFDWKDRILESSINNFACDKRVVLFNTTNIYESKKWMIEKRKINTPKDLECKFPLNDGLFSFTSLYISPYLALGTMHSKTDNRDYSYYLDFSSV